MATARPHPPTYAGPPAGPVAPPAALIKLIGVIMGAPLCGRREATVTIRSVLCPVDFSKQSREALVWASSIAERHGGELTVLTVVDPLLAHATRIRIGLDLARAETEPALRDFVAATLPASGQQGSKLRTEVQVGDAAEAILQTSRREASDLIVMGTHGLGGFRKLMLGSTTERVLRGTQTPVLAVAQPPERSGLGETDC